MKRGFVLLELILVIIILSLSLILVSPSLSRFSKSTELRSTAQKIAAILRHSRSEAIHKGKVYQIVLRPESREIRVLWIEPDGGSMEEEKAKQEVSSQPFALPSWISMEEVELKPPQYPTEFQTIEFYPNGGSNGGSLILQGDEQQRYRIKIHLITGMVEIEKVG